MSVEIQFQNFEYDTDGDVLTIKLYVVTSATDVNGNYDVDITTSSNATTYTHTGELYGGAGSYPGDSEFIEESFDITEGEGSVTVKFSMASEDIYVTETFNWDLLDVTDGKWEKPDVRAGEGGGGDGGDVTVSSCEPTIAGGDLSVEYSLAPAGVSGTDTSVQVSVGGQQVSTARHFVPRRGDRFTQMVPADDLPAGADLPVSLTAGGTSVDCGTVTVESEGGSPNDPEPDPANVRIADCSIQNDAPLRVLLSIDGDGSRGTTPVTISVNGQQVATRDVRYTLNPIDHTIEVPTSQLPVGENMSVSLSL